MAVSLWGLFFPATIPNARHVSSRFYTSLRNNIRRNLDILQILMHCCLSEIWLRSPDSRHGPFCRGSLLTGPDLSFLITQQRRSSPCLQSALRATWIIQLHLTAPLHLMKTYARLPNSHTYVLPRLLIWRINYTDWSTQTHRHTSHPCQNLFVYHQSTCQTLSCACISNSK